MFEEEINSRGREAVLADFTKVLRDIETQEGCSIFELLKTDMDRLVPIIGEALLEKFPRLGR